MRATIWTRRRIVAATAGLGGAALTSALPGGTTSAAGDAVPETAGWPSLLDVLPKAIQAAVGQGRYVSDLSQALQDAIDTGSDFVIPKGIYPFAGGMIELNRAGQRIVGTGGVLRRLAQRDGIGILVTAARVGLYRLQLDGTAPATQRSHTNDMVKMTGDDGRIVDLSVRGSQGSNLRIEGARNVRVIRPVLTDAYQNNLIICNSPTGGGATRDILVESPVCQRTDTQNNIYVTASAGGTDNGTIISHIVITDPLCTDAGDTGIELSYHCEDSRVAGGTVANSMNPPLLQRDGRRNRWERISVRNLTLARQHADYDGVAVVPLWEPASWDSDTEFNEVTVKGPVRRSAFYWGQSGIRRIGCDALGFADGQTDRTGYGDLKAGAVNNIVVRGGRIDGFVNGDDWNYDAKPYSRRGCITANVTFTRCDRVFSCYNITPSACAIVDNRGTHNKQNILLVRATLQPSDDRPNVGLIYDGNAVGASDPADPAEALLLTRNSRFVRVPASGQVAALARPLPGQYRLTVADGHLDFTVTARADTPVHVTDMPAAWGIDVTVAKGRLLLHQRGRRVQAVWVKISGPGICAAESA